MRSAILGLVLGIALLQMQSSLLPIALQIGLLALAFGLCLSAWALGWRKRIVRGPRQWLRLLLFCLAGASGGFAWASYLAQTHLDEALPVVILPSWVSWIACPHALHAGCVFIFRWNGWHRKAINCRSYRPVWR